ncbi:MAG TPA: 16S rRNA (cytosine(967)-C(5))-methyltransferase RsmB [Nitrospira sp.]|nr:16S rRNA (cytosine(967)-C(5))-methyltransferase RsmB [Nitrospira sp.]
MALWVLVRTVQSDDAADVLLDRALRRSSLDVRDRGLAVELAYGVLRRMATIDWSLQGVADRPLPRLPVLVLMILRLGAYQILFLNKIPPSAAVNESVKLAQAFRRTLLRDWSGFINAVLRSLLRRPAPDLPTIESEPVQALAVRNSIPKWLAARWIERHGITEAQLLSERSAATPPLCLRVNRLRTTRTALLDKLENAGVDAKPTAVSPVGVIVKAAGTVPSLPGFQEGEFYVEDEAAQLIPPLLDPQPGEVVLDACAAPGGKSTHLAELMLDRGVIAAVDRKQERLAQLQANCARLGVGIVRPILHDIRQASQSLPSLHTKLGLQDGFFDRIMVDAPCSGLGVLRRHPEAKWRKRADAFSRHQRVQLQILDAVAPCLRRGGVLVYSTCSTEREENEEVIAQFCRNHADFRRESVSPWLPSSARRFLTAQGDLSTRDNQESMDGFYAARLVKDD